MGKELNISGRAWVFGDNVDTDQILPGFAMALPRGELRRHAMAGSRIPDFSERVGSGDIIVGGSNFGCGSSREQAPVALKDAGVAAVVAVSFARIFRRNAINIGLPVLEADLAGKVRDGDTMTVDIPAGTVTMPDGSVVAGRVPGSNVLAILEAGGLIAKVRRQLTQKEE